MKKILLFPALMLLTACATCPCNEKGNNKMAMAMPAGQCVTVKVSGMTCEACAETVRTNLLKNPAIADVAIDVAGGTAKVVLKPGQTVSEAELRQSIERSDYGFHGLSSGCQ